MADGSSTQTPLRYVACVSYPRSGHHLTVRILGHYFGANFKYCRFYATSSQECCQQFPCRDSSVTMTKNHDMDSISRQRQGVPKIADVPYLVLVRNFLEAVVSDYDLYLRSHEDTEEGWRAFAQRKSDFYRSFVDKWALSADGLEKLVVRYEDLTSDPLTEFRQIIDMFRPSQPLDISLLTQLIEDAHLEDVRPTETRVVQNFGVRSRRCIEQFRHFDEQFFGELEMLVSGQLTGLGYALRFAAGGVQAGSSDDLAA